MHIGPWHGVSKGVDFLSCVFGFCCMKLTIYINWAGAFDGRKTSREAEEM